MLRVSGRAYADIVEQDASSNVLSSISFILNIMSSPAVGEVASSDEFAALSSLISRTNALLEHAPMIGNVAGTPTYRYWLRWEGTDSAGTFINTGVYAEGSRGADGSDGASFYVADVITGSAESDVTITDTPAILAGTSYYTDIAYGTKVGEASRIYPVADDNSIVVGGATYYVKAADIQSSNDEHRFYIMSVPQGIQGIQGVKGDTGAPGAGGVSWVDGITANTEREYHGDNECFSTEITGLTLDNSDKTKLSWAVDENLLYDDAKKYLKIGFSNSNESAPETYYHIQHWSLPTTGVEYTTGLTLQSALTTIASTAYFWGQQGEDSGDVLLYAVSYHPQASFSRYSTTGDRIVEEITPSMRAAARSNIDAMQNVYGTNNTTPVNGQIIGRVESDWRAININEFFHELDYNDLLITTQNFALASVEEITQTTDETVTENEGE